MTNYSLRMNVKGSIRGRIIGIRIRESMLIFLFSLLSPLSSIVEVGEKVIDEVNIDTEHPRTADTGLGWRGFWPGCVEGGR